LILVQSFSINIEDISKFDALLEHAQYHQKVYGDNFFQFLSEHYGNQMTSHQNKHKGHDKLPFKDHNHILSHINTAFTLFPTIGDPINQRTFTELTLNVLYKESSSSFEKPSVFQPPKFI
jgi:hypothetical protein